jgi:membrane protease YdiL (CAAX protease family)
MGESDNCFFGTKARHGLRQRSDQTMKPGPDHSGALVASVLEKPRLVGDGLAACHPARLIAETLTVATFAVGTVKWLQVQQVLDRQWLLIPAVLVLSATVPHWLSKREFPRIGLSVASIRPTLIPLAWVCGGALPIMIAGLWLIRRLHAPVPLVPVIEDPAGWPGWLLYQFLYVAVAEEVFFRGYVQSNVMKLCRQMPWRRSVRSMVTLVVSAGCFALAHAVVAGSPQSRPTL